LAAADDLRVTGDDRNACRGRRTADRGSDPAQVLDGQTLLDHVRDRQRHRLGAHHRQVVDGAMDRQGTDVPTGEEQRADHE